MMQTLNELNPNERDWLLISIAHILMADRVYEDSEREFFEKIIEHIFHREAKVTMPKIEKILKGMPLQPLSSINVDRPEHIVFIMDVLASAVYANGKLLHSESVVFYEAGHCLGLAPGTLTYRLNLEGEKFRVHQKLESFRKQLKGELSSN